jgi:hypothetical protein
MPKMSLPPDSKTYAEQVFREKEKWHRRQERMSFERKLEVLERLRQQRLLLKSARFVD